MRGCGEREGLPAGATRAGSALPIMRFSFPRAAVGLLALLVGSATALRAANATGTLVNLSTRIRVAEGGTPAIVGCALSGGGTRAVLVRAVGPSLAAFGVGGTLGDPKLTIFDAAGRTVATNNNWDAGGTGADIVAAGGGVGAFGLLAGSTDAAVVVNLGAGSYTVHVAGADNGGGVVLIELYALGAAGPKLVNLSVRGLAGQGADTLTAGFVVRGTPRTLLTRAIGPALAAFGVLGTLPNPRVSLLDNGQKLLGENRDWGQVPDPAALKTAMTTVGAFALSPGSLDAALTSVMGAGSYTAQVAEETGRTGEALIEVYDVSAIDPYLTSRGQLLSAFNIPPGTPAGAVKLTHLPLALADLGDLLPMGLAIFEHVTPADHMYIWPKNRASAPGTYQVFAPGDGFITSISHRIAFDGVERSDYRVTFEHSGSVFSYYDLIDVMDAAVIAQIPGGIPRGGSVAARVPVKGGQAVGRIGGRTLDFAVLDTERPSAGFVVPDHYLSEPWKVFTVDPYEAFTDVTKAQLLTKALGAQVPRGGRVGYDVSGRLVGNWFVEGTNGYFGANDPRGYWYGHLSIVYHFIEARSIIVSFGNFAGLSARQFGVKGNAPLPESVAKEAGLVKYELLSLGLIDGPEPLAGNNGVVQGTVLLQVLDDDRLRAETFPGKTAAQVSGFTSAAVVYER